MSSSTEPPTVSRANAAGGDVEAGLLSRLRQWTDVLPWLRLARVLRLAGSPIWSTITLTVLAIWVAGIKALDASSLWEPWDWAFTLTRSPGDWLVPVPPWPASTAAPGVRGWSVAWTLICGVPLAVTMTRMGGMLTAGRDMPGLVETWRFVIGRLPMAFIATFLPLAISLPLWIGLISAGWLMSISSAVIVEAVLLPLTVAAAFLLGLILVAAKVAVPLSWAAIGLEPDADPLDGLSRGFEYAFRRLPQLVLFAVVAALLTICVTAAFWLIATAVTPLVNATLAAPDRTSWTNDVLAMMPLAVATNLGYGMIGGIYLLLRQTAGGQEVEDIHDFPKPVGVHVPPVSHPIEPDLLG